MARFTASETVPMNSPAAAPEPGFSIAESFRKLRNLGRLLPAFIIIGTQRGGTTSLFNYLCQHPSIAAPRHREIHYFDRNFGRGIGWYQKHFRRVINGDAITGESSPYYMFHPLVPGRMAAALPSVKLIVLLRNPIDRAYSHYQHVRKKNKETLAFEEALDAEEKRLAGEDAKLWRDPDYYSEHHHRHAYQARGIYADQLPAWLEHFPRTQMHIVKSEEMYAEPGGAVATTLEFLRPDWAGDLARGDFRQHNASESEPMPPRLRERLTEYFRPHNQRLYHLLGRDFGWELTDTRVA